MSTFIATRHPPSPLVPSLVGWALCIRHRFIRAPYIARAGPDVEVLAHVDDKPVLAQQGRLLAAAFHPELTGDTRIHRYFLSLIPVPAETTDP